MSYINSTVVVSGADYFDDGFAINAYMDSGVSVDIAKTRLEHDLICQAFLDSGIEVIKVPAPVDCQDGVYAANWALCRGNKAVLASLPGPRQSETPYAEKVLLELGKEIIKVPEGLRFSGQGDALPCGNFLFTGSVYRTDLEVHDFLAKTLGYEVIGLQTIPATDDTGQAITNSVTGWPDSFFYDIDLALAVIRLDLIAWCPEAFMPESQEKIHNLPHDKIEVSLEEAMHGFACNLVSTGESVVMSNQAPNLQKALENHGLKTITPEVTELLKGGGFIRCTSLTLN